VVGLVIVSHIATLAAGVIELARQMGGEDVAIEAAGGMADPPGEIGTDMALMLAAIEKAASPDGVLVLMDLGSAVMSAEMAAEMMEGTEVLLCEAPIVEGAVAAAARARTGASLEEVATEARAAIGMKAAQLGVEVAAPAAAPPAPVKTVAASASRSIRSRSPATISVPGRMNHSEWKTVTSSTSRAVGTRRPSSCSPPARSTRRSRRSPNGRA